MTGVFLIATAFYGCGQNLGQLTDRLSMNNINPQNPDGAFERPFETLGTTDESAQFDDFDIVAAAEEEKEASSPLGKAELPNTGVIVVAQPTTTDPVVPVADPLPVPIDPVPVPLPVPVDPILPDPPASPCPQLDTYFLRVRWGQLVRDRRPMEEGEQDRPEDVSLTWMDWSGSLEASAGKLTLVKTILFEDNGGEVPQDLVHKQTNRKVIAFDSYTKPHYDGLLVKYQHCAGDHKIDPPIQLLPLDTISLAPMGAIVTSDEIHPCRQLDAGVALHDTPSCVPPVSDKVTLTFSAKGLMPNRFSKTWHLAELGHLNEIYSDVDANHDLFQIQSLKRDERCESRHGEIHGVWFKTNDRFGEIKGRVVSADGHAVGHIKGFYKKTDSNTDTYKIVAKFIDHNGKFKGILVGTGEDGKFHADILSRDRAKIGTVDGRYMKGDGRRKGIFNAIYDVACPVIFPVPTAEPE